METLERPAHKTYIDVIRILACIGVIYNHVLGHGVIESATQATYWALFTYGLSKMAVPLFLMITGALLLPRIDTYRKTFGRFLRIGFALAFAIALNYALYCIRNGAAFDAGQLVLSIYRDRLGITYSYWYLYRYMSLLIMLPILQRLAGRMTPRDIRYFLLFSVGVCGCAPAVDYFLLWLHPNEYLMVPLFFAYGGMLFLGLYIDRLPLRKRGYMLAAGIGLLLWNAITAFLLYYGERIDPERAWYLDRCDHTSIVLAAGCAYYLIKCADDRIALSARVRNGIARVGKLTFAVYLVSEFLIDVLASVRTWYAGVMSIWCADRLYVATVFLAGLAVAAVLTRIPLLKKLL